MDKVTFSRFSPGPTYVEPWGSAHVYGDPFTSLDFSLLELKGADILSRNRPHPKYTQGFKISPFLWQPDVLVELGLS